MTTNGDGKDAQGNRIDRCEIFWRCIAPGDEITIFFHVGGQLIGGGISGTHLRLASDNDDIAFLISLEMQYQQARVLQDPTPRAACAVPRKPLRDAARPQAC